MIFALAVQDLLPIGITVPMAALVLFGARSALRRSERSHGSVVRTQSVMLALTLVAVVAIVLALPLPDGAQHEVLNLLAVLGSAALALASTTFLSNVLAGLMLRSERSFRPGDFLRCEAHVGRVTRRGLLSVEIQTEDRDLTSLPNLFLIQKPTTVVRASGTILSTRVSLGYDVPRQAVEGALCEAAEAAGLGDPFVQIRELGDFSVTYRVAGLLQDVRQLISARARLNAKALDCLHAAGIEIVSPTFMNTRALAPNTRVVPRTEPAADGPGAAPTAVEDIVFDKADLAQSVELLVERRQALERERDELARAAKEPDAGRRGELEAKVESVDARLEYLERLIERRRGDLESDPRAPG